MNENDKIIEVEATTVHEEAADQQNFHQQETSSQKQTYTYYQQPQAKSNPKAVPAFVLGLLAIILTFVPFVGFVSFILAILGLVFGNQAKKFARENGGAGKGMASAGFICSLIALILWIIVILIIGIIVGVGVSMIL
ncbi:MAG: DUF4190 domain-containing protein [Clostridiales bacterium]|nr:DUF4190 domain-containing protein [Clostridiales bacterium]